MYKVIMDRESKNMVGKKIIETRKEHGIPLRLMAFLFQKNGLELDKNAMLLAEQDAHAGIDIELYYRQKYLVFHMTN